MYQHIFGTPSPDSISLDSSCSVSATSDTMYFGNEYWRPTAANDHFNFDHSWSAKSSYPDEVYWPCETPIFNSPMETSKKFPTWKYNEEAILKQIADYICSTYNSHYTSEDSDIQTIDLMHAKKLASPFCQANILKYGSRFGDKDGRNRRDILKVIHYAILLLHFENLDKPHSAF